METEVPAGLLPKPLQESAGRSVASLGHLTFVFARSKTFRVYVYGRTLYFSPSSRCCSRAGPATQVEGCLRYNRPRNNADAVFLDWSSENG